MNLICENYTYQLGDACEYQVGVKCILVLGFTSGQTEAVFYVIDRPVSYTHLYCLFWGPAERALRT